MSEHAKLEGGGTSIEVFKPNTNVIERLTTRATAAVIDDQVTYDMAAGTRVELLREADRLEAERKETVAPINTIKALVQDWYAPRIEAAKLAAAGVGTRQLAYRNEQERIAAEANAERERAARELRDKLAAEAKKADAAGNVERAEVLRETVTSIVAPVVKADFTAAKGESTRKVWKARVNEAELGAFYAYLATHPEYWYLAPVDEGAANALASKQQKHLSIPALEAFEHETSVQRRR